MAPLLETKNLKKYFKTKAGMLHAVDGIDLAINKGETLGVVGESGCGKSTLGRVILHLLESTDGSIFYEGKDVTSVTPKELVKLREHMQIIFQDPFSSLNPRMTVSEILVEPLIISGKFSREEIEKKRKELLDTVGLPKRYANSYPHELDGGRRQRIGIGRALALEPDFIVCDEPVSALDVSIQAQILNLLQDLQEERGLTYMFITHDLSVVKHISHDIMVMYLGQMVEQAPSDELFAHTWHPYTKALLSAIPVPDAHRRMQRILLKGEITSPVNPAPGCRFYSRCPYAKEACRQPQKIEEIAPGHFISCCMAKEINGLG
ncbi:MAG: ATP-binding cassette domain-containing protein [Blautia sp.]|nr:ATP-binding cassette domain-containing protein [Blautia sp.]